MLYVDPQMKRKETRFSRQVSFQPAMHYLDIDRDGSADGFDMHMGWRNIGRLATSVRFHHAFFPLFDTCITCAIIAAGRRQELV